MSALRLPILDLNLPSQRYSCHGCGNCCRDFTVQLRPDDLRKLAHQNWEARLNQPVTTSLRAHTFLRQNPDGSCIFLLPDGKCRIHAEFGFSQKPIACQLFPFHLNPAPRLPGRALHLQPGINFACQSVLENKGADLRSQRAELARMSESLADIFTHSPDLLLTPQLTAAPAEILALQSTLDSWFTQDLPLGTILHGLAWLTAQLLNASLASVRDDRFIDLLSVLRAALPDELVHHPPAPPTPGQLRLFRQAIFARIEDPKLAQISKSRLALKLSQLRRSRRFRLGRGTVPQISAGWPASISFSALASMLPAPPGEDALLIRSLLVRYLRATILSSRAWGPAYYDWPVTHGLTALVINLAAISWLARLHAAGQSRPHISIVDVRAALARIDRTAGRAPWLGSTIESLRLRYLASSDGLQNLLASLPLMSDSAP